jgi:hypothetical protein
MHRHATPSQPYLACVDCGKPKRRQSAAPRCTSCAKRGNDNRNRRKSCPQCGERPSRGGRRCADCAATTPRQKAVSRKVPTIQEHRRAKRDPCPVCGIPKPVYDKYCGRPCYDRWRREHGSWNRSGTVNVPCRQCQRLFETTYAKLQRGAGQFCSRECYQVWKAANPGETKSPWSNAGRRADLGDRHFRSAWEANWARYLNWLLEQGQIIDWDYECQEFEFEKVKRGHRFYLPDFKVTNLDGSVEFHEIKGYMDDRSRVKLERMARYYPDVVVKLIDRDAYKSIAREFKRRLPGWE